jgi:hypothetical protein
MTVDGNDGNGRSGTPVYRSLLDARAYTLRNAVLLAYAAGVTVYVLGFMLAFDGGFGGQYLSGGSVYFALFGVVTGTGWLLAAGIYHLRVWKSVRGCFAVSEETYRGTVAPVLKRAYSPGRIGTEILLALPVVLFVDAVVVGIPMAVLPEAIARYPDGGGCLSPSFEGLCMTNLAAINYLYGLVVLFVVVGSTHGVVHFLWLVVRVTDLPLSDVHTAAEQLGPIARFSIFVATSLFGGAIALVVPYIRLTGSMTDAGTLAEFLAGKPAPAFVVVLSVVWLAVMALVVFWIPQQAIHNTLEETKQGRIAAINDEYRELREACRSASEPVELVSAELEVIEAQRRNAKEIETWSYNLPTLLPFVASGLTTTVTWFSQLAGKIGLV